MRTVVLAILLAILSHGQAAGQAISFLPPVSTTYLGGSRLTELRKLAIADFNKDGKLDIAYLNEMISIPLSGVLFGTGGGSFRHDPEAIPGVHSGDVYTGDFDGDTNPDLIFGNGRTTPTRLLRGDGTGRFQDAVPIADCAQVSAVADVNRDGRHDLLCNDAVLLGDGAGGFRTLAARLPGSVLVAADFNGDGNTDLVIHTSAGRQGLALGAGNGTFGSVQPIDASAAFTSELAADFNGDRFMDLVMLSDDRSTITFLPGKGDGTFAAPRLGPGVPGALNAVADFNGDGKPDLIAEDALLAGNGDGTFRFPVFVGVVADSCASGTTPFCDYTHLVNAVADFNNDGLPDIAAGYVRIGFANFRGSSIAVLLNNSPGDGFLAVGVSAATGSTPIGPSSLVSAFGTNLSTETAAATAGQPAITLGGIRLHVRDRSHAEGWLAPLLYVSPTQINYILDSTDPYAWVDIERVGSPYVPKAMVVPIARLAPGLFTVGGGVAAAAAVRIAPDGTRSAVPVAACDASGCRPEPIDVTSGPTYLSLFGTGFSLATGATCAIGNQSLPASYVGRQRQFAGLDQINLLLPDTLRDVGEQLISCAMIAPGPPDAAQPRRTNVVKLSFR